MLLLTLANEETKQNNQSKAEIIDDNLILQIAKGDNEDAVALLYNSTSSAVYGFALSYLRDHYAAQDVMQDTFIKVITNAKNYKPMGKPLAWILTIAKNLSLMKLRARESKNLPLDNLSYKTPIQDKSKQSIDKIILDTALQILTAEERQIVTLYSVAGLKHKEIAEILDIPLSTQLSKYRRALKKLKIHLKEDFEL